MTPSDDGVPTSPSDPAAPSGPIEEPADPEEPSSPEAPSADSYEPDEPTVRGRVGEDYEVEGHMRLTVTTDNSGQNVRGSLYVQCEHSTLPREVANYGTGLSFDETRALLQGEPVSNGTTAIRLGNFEAAASRLVERLTLTHQGGDDVTLTLTLGSLPIPINEHDTRFDEATEAVFHGKLDISCGIVVNGFVDWGSFSEGACKDAADALGLWPLLPDGTP